MPMHHDTRIPTLTPLPDSPRPSSRVRGHSGGGEGRPKAQPATRIADPLGDFSEQTGAQF